MQFKRLSFRGLRMNTVEANEVMQEANRIIEDFPVQKFVLYTVLFIVEIGLCFALFKYLN